MKRFMCPRIAPYARILVAFLLTVALFPTGSLLPAVLAGSVSGIFSRRARWAFLFAGSGVMLAWAADLAYAVLAPSGGAASSPLALGLGTGGAWLLVGISLALGFLVGGVGGIVGFAMGDVFLWQHPPVPAADAPKDS